MKKAGTEQTSSKNLYTANKLINKQYYETYIIIYDYDGCHSGELH